MSGNDVSVNSLLVPKALQSNPRYSVLIGLAATIISSILGGGGEVNWFFYATVLGRFFDYNISEKARTGWKLARFIIENGNCVKNVRLPSQNLREADTRWKWPVNPKRGLSAVVACIASIPVLTERNRAAPRSFSCEKWSESNSGRAKCEAIAKTRK